MEGLRAEVMMGNVVNSKKTSCEAGFACDLERKSEAAGGGISHGRWLAN